VARLHSLLDRYSSPCVRTAQATGEFLTGACRWLCRSRRARASLRWKADSNREGGWLTERIGCAVLLPPSLPPPLPLKGPKGSGALGSKRSRRAMLRSSTQY
jgi:hypothetical protein